MADPREGARRLVAPVLLVVCYACAAPAPLDPVPPAQVVEGLPVLRVEQRAGADLEELPADLPLELQAPGTGERVTLTATGSDIRVILTALADAAGVNLVLSPDVQGRVSAHFEDVPAIVALDELVRGSGYMISAPLAAPWGPTVFYPVAVNVNRADAETLRVRFGLSAEMARFIVRARIPPN